MHYRCITVGIREARDYGVVRLGIGWKKKEGPEEGGRFRKAPVCFGRPPSLTPKILASRNIGGGMREAMKEPCCLRYVFYESKSGVGSERLRTALDDRPR